MGKNHKVNSKLLEITAAQEEAKKASKKPHTKGAPVVSRFRLTGKDIFATKKAKGPAEKASNKTQADHNAAVKASNDVASASKQVAKALADKSNTTPAVKRRSAAAGLDDSVEPQRRRRADDTQPARTTGAVEESVEEEKAPKRTARPKKPVAPQAVFSDGE